MLLLTAPVCMAQDNPLRAIVAQQEEEYKTLDGKREKNLQDYLKLVQLANSLGRNCSSIGFKAGEGSNERKVYLRYALIYYSLAAHNAQIAIDRFGSKSMARDKEKACKQAAFMYRSLNKPKKIYDDRFIDACGLFEDVSEEIVIEDTKPQSTSGGPLYVDEEFEKTLVGKRLFFKTPKQVFSMIIYEPFVITEEQATARSVAQKQFAQVIQMMPADKQKELRKEMNEKFDRAHTYHFDKDLGGLIFFAENQEESGNKMICDESDKEGYLSYKTSVSGAKACFSNIFTNPQTGERLKAGSSILQVEHKGDMFTLLMTAGENYNSAKHERIIKAMARSLRMEGVKELPKITVKKCKENATMQLAKGIPMTWRIIDRSRNTLIRQQPKMARDAEIGEAVSNYFAAVLAVMKGLKEGKQVINMTKKLVVDREERKALMAVGGWALDHTVKDVQFVPVEVEDYSSFEMDGALTTAAIFYVNALKQVSTGVGELGKKINKQSMSLYWEIPIITIQAECIPQMICNNGKWVPDYENLVFREISRTKGKITSPNKDFMTVRQVERDLERYFQVELEKAERAEGDYATALRRCDYARGQLYKIDFPVNIDQCPDLENEIQQLQYDILISEQIQKTRKEEFKRWVSVLKPAEVKKHRDRITELSDEIDQMNVELGKLKQSRDGHLSNGNTGLVNELNLKIKFLEEDIALLDSFREQSATIVTELSRGNRETLLSRELQEISLEITALKNRKLKVRSQLELCVKEYEKIR